MRQGMPVPESVAVENGTKNARVAVSETLLSGQRLAPDLIGLIERITRVTTPQFGIAFNVNTLLAWNGSTQVNALPIVEGKKSESAFAAGRAGCRRGASLSPTSARKPWAQRRRTRIVSATRANRLIEPSILHLPKPKGHCRHLLATTLRVRAPEPLCQSPLAPTAQWARAPTSTLALNTVTICAQEGSPSTRKMTPQEGRRHHVSR